jgi:hypothetical protein
VVATNVVLLLLLLQLHDYKPGSSRADLEESRAAARAQQGLEPDSDEVRHLEGGVLFPGVVCCRWGLWGCSQGGLAAAQHGQFLKPDSDEVRLF